MDCRKVRFHQTKSARQRGWTKPTVEREQLRERILRAISFRGHWTSRRGRQARALLSLGAMPARGVLRVPRLASAVAEPVAGRPAGGAAMGGSVALWRPVGAAPDL